MLKRLFITELREHPQLIKFKIELEDEGTGEVETSNEITIEPHVHFHSEDDYLHICWDTKLDNLFTKYIKTPTYHEASTAPLPIPSHYYYIPNPPDEYKGVALYPLCFLFGDVTVNGNQYGSIDELMLALTDLFKRPHHHHHGFGIDLDSFYDYVKSLIKTRAKKAQRVSFVPEINLAEMEDVEIEYHKRVGVYQLIEGQVTLTVEIQATLSSEIENYPSIIIETKLPEAIQPLNFPEHVSWFGSCYIFNLESNVEQLYVPVIDSNNSIPSVLFVRSHNMGQSFDTLTYGELYNKSTLNFAFSIVYLL
jgi:hypothetical protein